MAASKQASKHTHARVQCSPASVGLAQARPNDSYIEIHMPTQLHAHTQHKVKQCTAKEAGTNITVPENSKHKFFRALC